MRRILYQILPFLLPFVIYGLWVFFVRRKTKAGGGVWDDAPWTWLFGAGLAVMVATLFGVALLSGSEPGGAYQPPRVEDGKVVPGHVVPGDESR